MSELDPKTLKAASDQVLSHIAGMTGLDGMLRAIAHEIQGLAGIPGAEKGEAVAWRSKSPLGGTAGIICIHTHEDDAKAYIAEHGGTYEPLYATPTSERVQALESAANVIEENEIMDGSDWQYLRPRSDGNRAWLAYATGIRALKATP